MDAEVDNIPLLLRGVVWENGIWAVYKDKNHRYTVRQRLSKGFLLSQVSEEATLEVVRSK